MQPQSTEVQSVSIVIPVYNELNTWRQILTRVENADVRGLAKQILLVDDGSSDGTQQQLQAFANEVAAKIGPIDYKILFHQVNQGKGAALRTGFQAAGGDIVIIQDADLEYDPSDYPSLLAPIIEGRADVVYGSRFCRGRPPGTYLANYLANRFLTFLSNLTTHLGTTDMETCYKAFRRQVLGRITLEQNRFGFEPEITAKIVRLGARFCEAPISYVGRTHQQGKKIGCRDGLKAIWCIFKYRFLA